jgi:DNA-binding beta-propeller fold protein YncE
LEGPYGVSIIGGKLYVADAGNHRVLVYNTLPSSGGASADLVLGAPDLNTAGAGLPVSGSTMKAPIAVASASNHLYVNDYSNWRILVWSTVPTASGTPADSVIGQTDPNSAVLSPYPQANTLALPVGLATDGTRLFISDASNQRLLIVPTTP